MHDGSSNYICMLRKTYEDESIIIIINLDTFEQTLTLDREALGATEIVGELYIDVTKEATWNEDGTLVLPAQSIVILK